MWAKLSSSPNDTKIPTTTTESNATNPKLTVDKIDKAKINASPNTKQSSKWQEIVEKTKKRKNEIKNETQISFESLLENPKYNETLKEVIAWLGSYIDMELWKNFKKEEKNNIKLVLLNYFSEKANNIDTSSIILK